MAQIEPDVDIAYEAAKAAGEDCVFLSFAPPQQTPLHLKCPVIPVFAWEFSTVPTETWDDNPRNDWRYVFNKTGRAITLATDSAKATKRAMGEDFPVMAIAAPCWDRMAHLRQAPRLTAPQADVTISLRGAVVDSRGLRLSPDYLLHTPATDGGYLLEIDRRRREIANWRQRLIDEQAHLAAVRAREEAHEAAALARIRANKDRRLHRRLRKRLSTKRFRAAVAAEFGELTRLLLGLPPPRTPDPVAEQTIAAEEPEPIPPPPPPPQPPAEQVRLTGIVYTSVFCPRDGRKNWLDFLKAFCIAFRDVEDATLVLKLVADGEETYLPQLLEELSKLSPLKCRVVAIDGFLEGQAYDDLMRATAFYVNASHCEGLCMPQMEFMACGAVAVSPRHTAMEDYVEPDNAFIVASSYEQNVWPMDPRLMYRTTRQRIDWESLLHAFEESYRVAKQDPSRYGAMSAQAIARVGAYSSDAEVERRLRAFLAGPVHAQAAA